MKSMVLFLCLLSCACAHKTKENAKSKINGALTTPLKDLNLIQEKIPHNLLEARKNPYAIQDSSCDQLQSEIQALNKVLAPDIDQPVKTKAQGLERGVEALGNESIKAIRRTTESLIPYRSWVRKLTGAEKSSKIVADAIWAGNLRRAFLKGYSAQVCKEN
jgi:hypothetical protein